MYRIKISLHDAIVIKDLYIGHDLSISSTNSFQFQNVAAIGLTRLIL